ncbi:MAG: PAS domain-containing protein [Lewinella sp.]|nr:PAS domain-containing protein [Lewinella sp.]
MSLKWRYWLLVVAWHLAMGGLAFAWLRDSYALFMAVQLLLVCSLYLAYRLYRSILRPLDLITGGKAALRDRDFSVKYRHLGYPEVDALVDVYNTMIDTLREERTQAEQQHFFLQKLIAASPTGILILDYDGRITEANPRAVEQLGFDPTARELLPAQADHPLLRAARAIPAGESETLTLEGAAHYRLEVNAFVDRGFSRKFVQVQDLSHEILAAEKRAYGKVIRMMAHEVNNSIGAVNALLQVLSDPAEATDDQWTQDVRESLPIAIQRNDRLNTFMRNFADVVRLPPPRLERVDLLPLVEDTLRLMEPQARRQRIELIFFPPANSVWVSVDPRQVEQVLVNIIKNACESIGADGQVQLRLQPAPPLLEIADNGPGLSEEAAGQVFSPFFTTKATGQGVGLTLVREILSQHGARFSLRTDEDGWTRFQIQFDGSTVQKFDG